MINLELKRALKELISWAPEYKKPSDFANITGFPIEQIILEDNQVAFLSEAFLYPLLGKEDARSFLVNLRCVCRSAGFDLYDLEQEIARENENIKQR